MLKQLACILAGLLCAGLIVPPGLTARPAPAASDLDEWIGQMIMVGFRGLQPGAGDPIVADLTDRRVGGVILFDYDVEKKSPVRNIESADQVKALVRSLQEKAGGNLFVAIDQEGGRVSRLKEKFGFPPTVSAQYLGSAGDLDKTREYAERTASLLQSLGINVNFAPVLDLNTNPENPVIGKLERSFSADPRAVTDHALAWIRAHKRHGVLSGLKHFPGHGSSKADSHLGFVDVSGTWTPAELEPYRRIIQAGEANIVMTAHIFNRHLDPELPGTLSRAVITGLLRQRLKYEGVVVSDDLQMKAITAHYGLETAIEKAVHAGVDVLVFGNNSAYEPDIAARSVAILKKLVAEGRIPRERLQESYRRVMGLKNQLKR